MIPLRERLEELAIAARFAAALPGYLRAPATAAVALATIRTRRQRRADDFLALVDSQVYTNPDSPYLALLRHAGCEFGDLSALVRRDGLDEALRQLFRRGVYLTIDELKGTTAIRRGSLSFTASARAFRNRSAARHLAITSGGSSGPVRGHLLDLAALRELSVNYGLATELLGHSPDAYACWETAGPVMTATFLWFAAYFGRAPVRAFRLDRGGDHGRLQASLAIAKTVARPLGLRFPTPQLAPIDDPITVLDWLAAELRRGARPGLRTFPTSAMRLADAAVARGQDLRGARVTVAGEPLTAARLATIRAAGLEVASLYGASECGLIGYSCLAPETVDDLHLHDDLHAVVRLDGDDARADLPEGALLMTSLRSHARLILLNASLGDTAEVVQRACGCRFEEIGWTTHLHTVRSFEKLNSAGMTFRGPDIVRALEEVLPARFGGTPADYQVVDGETESGAPRVVLRIHPRLGAVDGEEAKRVFLAALGAASDINRVMSRVWSDAGVLEVVRHPPEATARGKLLPFRRATLSSAAPE